MSDKLPDHLWHLDGTSWALWRVAGLRSGGFPADLALGLGDSELMAATDQEPPAPHPSTGYRQAYQRAWQRAVSQLASIAREPRFREAVTWQNPSAVATCLDRIAGAPAPDQGIPPAKQREKLLTTAAYLQRYTVKNDFVGFFGPAGWAHWTGEATPVRVVPGPQLLHSRTVYFERWAVQLLAEVLTGNPALFGSLRPRRSPELLFEDGTVHTAQGRRSVLADLEAQLIEACDGVRTVAEVLERAAQQTRSAPEDPALLACLQDLQRRGLLRIELSIPIVPHPEQALRDQLQAMPESAARARALAGVDSLSAAKEKVGLAAGDPVALSTALGELRSCFVDLTGVAPHRRPGQMYAGRTLLYEDTVRDVEVGLGDPLQALLAPPLELILHSARWFAAAVAGAFSTRLREAYDRISRRLGSPRVPLGRLAAAVTPDLVFSFNTVAPLVDRCGDELRRRWATILPATGGQSRLEVASADIRPAVRREFPVTTPPWSGALRHSPDLMLAAAGPAALAADDYYAVLGEIHVSTNTLEAPACVAQASDPGWLRAAEAADHGGRRVVSLPSRNSTGVNSRSFPSALYGPAFSYWTMYPDPVDYGEEPIPAAALEVVDRDGTLLVTSKSGESQYHLLEIFGEPLAWATMNGFGLLPSAAHSPRVTVDRLVVARESWRFPADDLTWAKIRDGDRRFLAARRWQSARGLPDRCFYSLPVEVKPQFVDFTSVVFVDLFARGIRRTQAGPGGTVAVTEMLPDVHQTWLTDRAGHRYTAELRMVAVDLTGRRSS